MTRKLRAPDPRTGQQIDAHKTYITIGLAMGLIDSAAATHTDKDPEKWFEILAPLLDARYLLRKMMHPDNLKRTKQ